MRNDVFKMKFLKDLKNFIQKKSFYNLKKDADHSSIAFNIKHE